MPRLRPGARPVVLKAGKRRLRGRVRIRRGFTSSVEPTLDRARARSATIGAAGGVLAATGADGTRYELSVTAGALVTGGGSVGVLLEDDVVVNRTGEGAFTGSLAVPADGESRSLVIGVRHGGEGGLGSTVSCKFDRPSVVVPD